MTLASRMTDLAAAVRDKFNAIAPRLIPTGGADGQFLQKTGAGTYGWADAGGGSGGTAILDFNGPSGTPAGFILDLNG